MARINNTFELEKLKKAAAERIDSYSARVLVCMTGCRARGAVEVAARFREELAGSEEEYAVVDVGCHGQCSRAPLILIEPKGLLYGNVKPDDVSEIIEKSLKGDEVIERLCGESADGFSARREDVNFYRNQQRQVLSNCGRIDPKSIEEAIAVGG